MAERDDGHTDEQLADLADVILALARTISTDAHLDARVVDLTAGEINVMRFVDRHPGTSPSAVAAATGTQRSNLSRTLRELESKGMIEKSNDGGDGRQAQLHPTGKAAANLARLRANWSRLLTAADADRSKLAVTLELLTQLEAGLGRTGR